MTRRTANAPRTLSARALNRALLARQHLLERSAMPPLAMAGHLVGMQAQNPLDPYVGLWSRLEGFDPARLSTALEEREAVRMGLLRTTLHLVPAEDARSLWPIVAPVLRRAWQSSPFRKRLEGFDLDAIVAAGREVLEAAPRTSAALGRALADRWPDADAPSLGYAARFLLPIVQLPPRGTWGRTSQPAPTWTTLEAWLGRPIPDTGSLDALVIRYLAAFGPASPADARTWSWLTGLRAPFERLRNGLVTVRDERGRELFDLPDAPRPPEDAPAPPRFLPEYDNVLLSHDDRTRILPPDHLGRLTGWVGSFLVDGFVAGQWRIDRGAGHATLVLEPFEPLTANDEAAVVAEATALLAFQAPDTEQRALTFGVARPAPTDGRPGIGGTRRAGGRASG